AEDYCTLLTCAPYGINTHRLLVRGSRIRAEESTLAVEEPSATDKTDSSFRLSLIIAQTLLAYLLVTLLNKRKKL
ncbi:MAG: class C sortase, partial [Eubacteriales bacterium]|nr:class C sortase [Eubacteriales bacterium]